MATSVILTSLPASVLLGLDLRLAVWTPFTEAIGLPYYLLTGTRYLPYYWPSPPSPSDEELYTPNHPAFLLFQSARSISDDEEEGESIYETASEWESDVLVDLDQEPWEPWVEIDDPIANKENVPPPWLGRGFQEAGPGPEWERTTLRPRTAERRGIRSEVGASRDGRVGAGGS